MAMRWLPIVFLVACSGGKPPAAAPGPGSAEPVGVVKVWRGANVAVEAPIYAAEAVGTGSTVRRAIDGASELVIGMFRASAEKL